MLKDPYMFVDVGVYVDSTNKRIPTKCYIKDSDDINECYEIVKEEMLEELEDIQEDVINCNITKISINEINDNSTEIILYKENEFHSTIREEKVIINKMEKSIEVIYEYDDGFFEIFVLIQPQSDFNRFEQPVSNIWEYIIFDF